jgi:hypothetical protein
MGNWEKKSDGDFATGDATFTATPTQDTERRHVMRNLKSMGALLQR